MLIYKAYDYTVVKIFKKKYRFSKMSVLTFCGLIVYEIILFAMNLMIMLAERPLDFLELFVFSFFFVAIILLILFTIFVFSITA